MRLPLWRVCVLALLAMPFVAAAEPLLPGSDDALIETLPVTGGAAAEQRRLRRQLALQPRDAALALGLSRSILERARRDGDARLAGQALGVLARWDGDPAAPAEIRLQRATLQQHLHQFDRARGELEALLQMAPRHAQALLTLATVLRVQGHYAASDAACRRLHEAGQPLYARACVAENRGLRGERDDARREFEALLVARPGQPDWAAWIRTSLGELEAAAGRPERAIGQFREALREADDPYARMALADALIDHGRWTEAESLLGDPISGTGGDATLLRQAIVARALQRHDAPALRAALAARWAQASLRPEASAVHARERARFALDVEGEPARALMLARANLAQQRESADFVLMARAAHAAGDAAALAEVAALAVQFGLRDARLDAQVASFKRGRT